MSPERESHEPRPAGEASLAALRLIRDRARRRAELTGNPDDAPPPYVDRILQLWEGGERDAARAMMTEYMEQAEAEADEDAETETPADDPRLF